MFEKIGIVVSGGKEYKPIQFRDGEIIVVDGMKLQVTGSSGKNYFREIKKIA
ncbi:MAG: hypothetical protein LBV67_04500 [Streptococcaceae bacterium]|jgi:hypothetical protein|nr:hypothetical protein [Streptococcaceae bacterium]